jgi:hypothetical protein
MSLYKGVSLTAAPNTDITGEFLQAVDGLRSASRMLIPDDGDAGVYRARLYDAMTNIKATSMKLLQAGHMAGIEQLSDLNKTLNSVCGEERNPVENEIFWDELANHYPPLNLSIWKTHNLSGPLQIKLGVSALEQMREPKQVPLQILKTIPNADFMQALTTVITRLIPPYRRFDMNLHETLAAFGGRLGDEQFRMMAADYLVAHQDFYFPILKKLLDIAQTPPIIAATDAQSILGQNERYERQLLAKLDYLPHEVDEMYATAQHQHLCDLDYLERTGKTLQEINKARQSRARLPGLPTTADLQQINKSLAWPAEFLVMLQDACQHPLIKDLARVAFDYPAGSRAYMHFEKLGFMRTPQWHLSAQEKSHPNKTAALYDYAIHIPGIELGLGPLSNKDFELKAASLNTMIQAIASAPLKEPEAFRKAQALFDALIARAEHTALPEPWIIEAIRASAISPKYYRKHKTLCVDLLEDRLGL